MVNSVSGEEKKLETVLPLVKDRGAAVIGLTMDDNGIPKTPEERLSVAEKIIERAAKMGIPVEDIIIDPLALTVAADSSAVKVTLRAMQMIRDTLGVNMSCGAGNISFGLPERPPITAAFLSMAMPLGLTCAITDATDPTIRIAVRASDVLLGRDEYAVNWISEFRQKKQVAAGRE